MKSIQSSVEIEMLVLGKGLFGFLKKLGYAVDHYQHGDTRISLRVCDSIHAPAKIDVHAKGDGMSQVTITSAARDNPVLHAGEFALVDSQMCGTKAPDFIFDLFNEAVASLIELKNEVEDKNPTLAQSQQKSTDTRAAYKDQGSVAHVDEPSNVVSKPTLTGSNWGETGNKPGRPPDRSYEKAWLFIWIFGETPEAYTGGWRCWCQLKNFDVTKLTSKEFKSERARFRKGIKRAKERFHKKWGHKSPKKLRPLLRPLLRPQK